MNLHASMKVLSEEDIVAARQSCRTLAQCLGFDDVLQAQLASVASELAQNMYEHVEDGMLEIFSVSQNDRLGLRIVVRAQEPDMLELQKMFDDLHKSSAHLGAGLVGVKRMMDEFLIETKEEGTTITTTKWIHTEELEDAGTP